MFPFRLVQWSILKFLKTIKRQNEVTLTFLTMKNKSYIIANKPIGKTPFEVIQEIKKSHPELKNTKIGYAGRLDPMAEGLLLLLIGEENKKKHAYENLNKTYECEIFFGFATDTYDLMGMITSQYTHPLLPFDSSFQENINDIFSHLKGTREQKIS